MKIKTFLAGCLIYLQLLITLAVVMYPIMWLLGSALSPVRGSPGAVTAGHFSALIPIPRDATLDNFVRLFSEHNFSVWYRNTLIIATLTMTGTVVINTFMGFVFARLQFRGRKVGLLALTTLQMFPPFLSMTAIYVIYLTFGWLDNIYPLVLMYITGAIPASVWLVRGYMLSIPKSLDEAAYIDGASKTQVFAHVIFPLSLPIITFVGFTSFMLPWMDFILPRLLLRHSSNITLALGLFSLADHEARSYDITAFTAGALIVGVPITILYFIFQRFLLTGITAGANKGE